MQRSRKTFVISRRKIKQLSQQIQTRKIELARKNIKVTIINMLHILKYIEKNTNMRRNVRNLKSKWDF